MTWISLVSIVTIVLLYGCKEVSGAGPPEVMAYQPKMDTVNKAKSELTNKGKTNRVIKGRLTDDCDITLSDLTLPNRKSGGKVAQGKATFTWKKKFLVVFKKKIRTEQRQVTFNIDCPARLIFDSPDPEMKELFNQLRKQMVKKTAGALKRGLATFMSIPKGILRMFKGVTDLGGAVCKFGIDKIENGQNSLRGNNNQFPMSEQGFTSDDYQTHQQQFQTTPQFPNTAQHQYQSYQVPSGQHTSHDPSAPPAYSTLYPHEGTGTNFQGFQSK